MKEYDAIEEAIEKIKAIMLAYATDGRIDEHPKLYHNIYVDLDLLLAEAGLDNPNPYKTIEQFWKDCGATWATRRELISDIYADISFSVGKKKKQYKVPKAWEKANLDMKDNLFPVREQWLKARNFIFSTSPDYENAIKESVNSIESCLMILLNRPNETLGQLIKDQTIDKDIGKIISTAYGLFSNKDFVRHGGVKKQEIGKQEAEFVLDFAATSIIYVIKKLNGEK